MTFYLQQHEKNGRWIIDSTFPLNAHRVTDSRDAAEWLEAKKCFGYGLSPTQEMLLQKHDRQRQQAVRVKTMKCVGVAARMERL